MAEIDRNDCELLVDMVIKAGKIAKTHYDLNDSQIWNKSNNSPVTDADIAVNSYLLTELMNARPGYGWLSEETKDDGSRRTAERVFVVDPIDGTRAFIKRKPHFVVSLAVITEDGPVAGALYNPLTEELFEAYAGGGAKYNGKPITVRDCAGIAGCTMIGYDFKFIAKKWPAMICEVRNSMAYRIALVAAGQADATVAFTPKSDWDLAAAEIIAREAGAVITDIDGAALLYNRSSTTNSGVICAGPTLHPKLLEQVKSGASKTAPPSPRN